MQQGPIIFSVAAKNKNTSLFLEMHFLDASLLSFVVESKTDYDLLYKHPRELALQIESSSQLCQKISVTLEKNLQGTCALFYRKKYYEEARTVSYHIPAYFFKLHGEEVLNIFNLHFQDLSRETQWK